MEGIVIKSTGSWSSVRTEDGRIVECRLKGQFRIHGIRTTNPVAVGDHVQFDFEKDSGQGIIYDILKRRNYIIRKSINLSKSAHIIASNIDRLYVIASIEQPRTSTGFIDRVLVTAEAYHIPATIVFNKIDLYRESSVIRYTELMTLYSSVGYGVFAVSAKTGLGIDRLKADLKDHVSLFTGHSGVGKSALMNALEPNLNIRTGEISDYHSKGMHTTTFAEMHQLTQGGYIVDTPGIKEFGLVHFESQEIAERFPEFRDLLPGCHYKNCTHIHEPGCAVKEALALGKINQGRYSNYLGILNDENLDVIDYD
ncbi:MAG: ribosome small subunit-dependent GTPase A [Bacteroidetes bacterium]|nr:ribosome small subunit-dependent GTPase A [Bacteroidota bacterium]